jgi:outer membrane protein OmpA-like peptidoglycan-associated protein
MSPYAFTRSLVMALVFGSSVFGLASVGTAQTVPQFDLNQFRPSELTTDGFAVSQPDGQGHLRFGVQIYFDFARDPLELQVTNGPIPDQRLQLVHSQLTGHLVWSLGLWERLVIFMDLPYTFMLNDSLNDSQLAFLDSIGQSVLVPRGRGLGDLYVGARGVLYGTREHIFQIAAQATLTTNTASASRPDQNYLGEPSQSPKIGGWFEVLANFNAGDYIRIPLNVGYKTNFQQEVPSLGVGNQLTFGAGVQALLGQDRFMVTVETFGRTSADATNGFGGIQESPVEILGGFKFLHPKGFATGIAGTGGVTAGYGNPDWRLIGMIGYTMPGKQAPTEPELDTDGDGILDLDDACPNEPGPPENDGCPVEQQVVIESGSLQIVDKIYFDFDSAKLLDRSHPVLDGIAEVLIEHPEVVNVRIEGHTDSRGSAEYNMKLSQRRAESVMRYLVQRGGVSKERMVAEGFGETQPLLPDAQTDEEHAQNRRVEFYLTEEEAVAGGEEETAP